MIGNLANRAYVSHINVKDGIGMILIKFLRLYLKHVHQVLRLIKLVRTILIMSILKKRQR